jgi:hypothetical protein
MPQTTDALQAKHVNSRKKFSMAGLPDPAESTSH